VCARQELDFSHIDVPTPPLRDPEIRRVDGSVQQQQQRQLHVNLHLFKENSQSVLITSILNCLLKSTTTVTTTKDTAYNESIT